MPGLVGIVSKNKEDGIVDCFANMIDSVNYNNSYTVDKYVDKDLSFQCARIHNKIINPESQPYRNDREGVSVWVEGELFNRDELKDGLKAKNGEIVRDPQLIHDLYMESGVDFAVKPEGTFVIIIFDKQKGNLYLISDHIGTRPLHFSLTNGCFTFANEVKAILKNPQIIKKMDKDAVADFFMFGFLMGDKTLVENVKVLPPASILSYNVNDCSVEIKPYWHLGDIFCQSWDGNRELILEEINGNFKRAVNLSLMKDKPNLISLSGGLDSRAVLSAVDVDQYNISTYTLGVTGCADQKLADRMAHVMGIENKFLEMNQGYLERFVENIKRMVFLADGMYLTHGVTEIIAREFLEENSFATLLRGHGGEIAKASLAWPFCVNSHVLSVNSAGGLIDYLMTNTCNVSQQVDMGKLFMDDTRINLREMARNSLECSLRSVSDKLSPGDMDVYLYIQEQHRRYTCYSLMIFGSCLEVRVPFVDLRFLESLLKAPLEMRLNTNIHKYIINKNNPELMKIPDSNTGAPVSASASMLFLFDKVNTIFKKLKIGGFKHYHDFNNWLRESQRKHIRDILLDPITLNRGPYDKCYVEQLLEEHNSGKQNHGYLFEVMMILELYQREFF